MKVVILCGGMGTRLREETEHRPKPMVEIGGYPLLWHLMNVYASQGFDEFVLCLGYKGDVIRQYFLNYDVLQADFTVELGTKALTVHRRDGQVGWRVTCAETGRNAMTGARVSRIRRYVEGERFMLTYGDGLGDVDISALLRCHEREGCVATLTAVQPPGRFGELSLTGTRVAAFEEKPIRGSAGHISGGFFVCEPEIFEYLTDDDGCTLEREPLTRLAGEGELAVYAHHGFWACMDTYRDYQHLNELWESGRAPWVISGAPAGIERR